MAKKLLGIVIGTAMFVAACGGSDAESAQSGDDPATTTTTEPNSTDGSADEPPQKTTTTEPVEEVAVEPPTLPVPDQWLDGVASQPPSVHGWPVAADRWASAAFDPAIAFDMPAGLSLLDHAPWSIRLGLDREGTTGEAHLVRTSTIAANSVWVPIPRTLDGIDAFLEENDTTVVDRKRIEGVADIGWWQVVIDDDLVGFPCSLGTNCVQLALTTANSSVLFVPGEPFTIFAYRADNVRYGAFVTGPEDEQAELVAALEKLLPSSTVLADESAPPEFGDNFIGGLKRTRTTLEAGGYHHILGDNHIELELAESIDNVAKVFTLSEMVILGMPAGDLALIAYENLVVDPSQSQAGITSEESHGLTRLDDPPTSIDEWSTYADELGVLTATGTTEIGGAEIPWFEFEVEPGTGFDCVPDYATAGECIDFLSIWQHSDAESANRHFVFGEEMVMVVLVPAPSNTIDDVLASYEPILAGLTITRP